MQRITWRAPENDSVTQIEISRCTTKYGTYSVIDTIDATSDGEAKSSSNTWVTYYDDTTGTTDDWYKIRFFDGDTASWSDYSEPFSMGYHITLCTVDDVKNTIETVGRWTDAEIYDTIEAVDDLIYIECGTPIESVYSDIGQKDGTVQRRYYVGEENVYRIDRVFYGTTTKTELYDNDGYKAKEKYGMVEILPVASSGITPEIGAEIEVRYVPRIFHKLSLYRTCKTLLEQLDFISNGDISKELKVINARLNEIETYINHAYGLQITSMLTGYDTEYGVNRRKIVQDFYRNEYIGGDSSRW